MGISFYVDPEVAKCVFEKNTQYLKELESKREQLQKAGISTTLVDAKIQEVKNELSACAYYSFGEH